MESEKKRTLLEILKELAETSALHGIPKIASSRQLAVKIFWCILVLTAVGFMTFQLVELFQTFFSNPVQTTVSLDFSTLQFPAITVCNMNPVRKSKLDKSPNLMNQLFPTKKRDSSDSSTQNRLKRDLLDVLKPISTLLNNSDFDVSIIDIGKEVTSDDKTRKILAFYNVSTLEEFKELFGNVSAKTSGTSSVIRHVSGSVVYTHNSSHPETIDKSFQETWIESETYNLTRHENNTTTFGPSYVNVDLTEIAPVTDSDSTDEPLPVSEIHPPEDLLNISETYTAQDTFNVSDINTTEDPYNISETTEDPYNISEKTEDQYNISETTEDQYNFSETTEDPWFGDLYESFDWDIFHDTEANFSFNYNTSEFEVSMELVEHFNDPKDKWEQVKTGFKTTFRSVDIEERKYIGHQLTDFVQYASFAKRQQDIPTYFEQFTTSEYGNCYTLDNSKFKSWRSGPENGIKLTLNLEVDEYVESFSSGYGVRIVFHQPGTFPMPAEEGLTINPGYETSIGLRAINVTRLGGKYGHCTFRGSEWFKRKYNVTYSTTACLEFCRIENIISRCKCTPIDAPDIDFGVKMPVCKAQNELCAFEVELMFEEGNLQCDCINPCTEFVYAKTISGRAWPHRDYMEKILMKDMCEKDIASLKKACRQLDSDTKEFDYDRYKNNFIRVIIYFEDLNYQKITEEPFYTTVRFICDIGGAMGLFIGVSILSLFEVLQLILEIAIYLIDRNRNNPKINGLVEKDNLC